MRELPEGIAIVVIGPSGAALGRRLRTALPHAELHGPRAKARDWDQAYDRAAAHIASLFADGRPIVGICASGILIRSLAPLLTSKQIEPPVVAVAEDGSVAVPLIGGHHGANAIAREIAAIMRGTAAITTAGDLRLGFALDEPPTGWRIANAERVKPVVAALLAGEPVALVEDVGGGEWLRAEGIEWASRAAFNVIVTDRSPDPETAALVYHPPVLALGIGCERGCSAEEIAHLAGETLAVAGLAAAAVAAVVSIDLKLAEPGIHALAHELGVMARFFPAERLCAETERLTERSDTVYRATGCWGVAEAAALACSGPNASLIVPKRKSRRATCAVARAPQPINPAAIGRGRGRLTVVGIGPGASNWRTGEASTAIAAASDIVGYRLYLDLIGSAIAGKRRHESALGEEKDRVGRALDLAAEGRNVALVSSGDAGIYGVATLVFEMLDREPKREWEAVEVTVCPGVSALQAAAARAGAPLGHDFCAISLSDLLTPWPAIRSRLELAAAADFVVALFNPRSARRTGQLAEAAEILLRHRWPHTPVFIGRNLGRSGETTRIAALSDLATDTAEVDMLSVIIVGNSTSRVLEGYPPCLYTPRGYFPHIPQ
jgi:cobalt-precorrin 5A hydrolase / cobalt-factor III methyltransferase / precorrin-3B C17-methyltransferase